MVCDMTKKDKAIINLIRFLNDNEINFEIIDCCGKEKICIDFNGENESHSTDIIVRTSNKAMCRIHPDEIVYVTIDERTSIVYVADKCLEVNLPLRYWKETLNPEVFAQPHSSFLVNLNYVEEVTKDFVKLKYNDKTYTVYTSKRKIKDFQNALLEFNR